MTDLGIWKDEDRKFLERIIFWRFCGTVPGYLILKLEWNALLVQCNTIHAGKRRWRRRDHGEYFDTHLAMDPVFFDLDSVMLRSRRPERNENGSSYVHRDGLS